MRSMIRGNTNKMCKITCYGDDNSVNIVAVILGFDDYIRQCSSLQTLGLIISVLEYPFKNGSIKCFC